MFITNSYIHFFTRFCVAKPGFFASVYDCASGILYCRGPPLLSEYLKNHSDRRTTMNCMFYLAPNELKKITLIFLSENCPDSAHFYGLYKYKGKNRGLGFLSNPHRREHLKTRSDRRINCFVSPISNGLLKIPLIFFQKTVPILLFFTGYISIREKKRISLEPASTGGELNG